MCDKFKLSLLLCWAVLSPTFLHANAQFILQILDPPGVGFNDPTPAVPINGNNGTTLGEQRINAFLFAANIWGQAIDSTVPIIVSAQFQLLSCDILAGAGPTEVFADEPPRAPCPGLLPNTWYTVAEAEKRVGYELNLPGAPDIDIIFNDLESQACPQIWDYGFIQEGGLNFVSTALHEIAHGLGFISLVDLTTGQMFLNMQDIYTINIVDATQGKTWQNLTDAERAASAINTGNVYWNGATVTAESPLILDHGAGTFDGTHVLLYAPNPLELGSSISHWDTSTFPNQLMEPFITPTDPLAVTPPQDLTLSLMRDIGWFKDSNLDCIEDIHCPNNCTLCDSCAGTQLCDPTLSCVPDQPPTICPHIDCKIHIGCTKSGKCLYEPDPQCPGDKDDEKHDFEADDDDDGRTNFTAALPSGFIPLIPPPPPPPSPPLVSMPAAIVGEIPVVATTPELSPIDAKAPRPVPAEAAVKERPSDNALQQSSEPSGCSSTKAQGPGLFFMMFLMLILMRMRRLI